MCLRMFALTIVVISGAHVCRTTGKVPCQNVAALGTYPERYWQWCNEPSALMFCPTLLSNAVFIHPSPLNTQPTPPHNVLQHTR